MKCDKYLIYGKHINFPEERIMNSVPNRELHKHVMEHLPNRWGVYNLREEKCTGDLVLEKWNDDDILSFGLRCTNCHRMRYIDSESEVASKMFRLFQDYLNNSS